MPSPVFMLLSHTDWSAVAPSDEEGFAQGLKSWSFDPHETVDGQNLLQALLKSFGRRETPFLNGLVHTLLDRGVDPSPALEDEARCKQSANSIQWGHYPTLVRVLQSRASGEKSNSLDLGLSLLNVLSTPMGNTGQVIAEMELLLNQGVGQEQAWARPIEGLKAAVWLALQSVDGPGEASGWQNAFSSWSESGVHKMRVLRAILSEALKEGALTDEETWVVHAAMASMVSQREGSQSERKQAVVLRKSFQGPLFEQLPSHARKTQKAVACLAEQWSEQARQQLARAVIQAASKRLATAGGQARPACFTLIRFGLGLALSPTANLFPNPLATKALMYWMGDVERLAADWAKTEEGIQLGIALWAASWNDKADPGTLAQGNRRGWVEALGGAIRNQSKPLGAQWPTVQALVAGALEHPEAFDEWKPLQAFINQDALENRLPASPGTASAKPRL